MTPNLNMSWETLKQRSITFISVFHLIGILWISCVEHHRQHSLVYKGSHFFFGGERQRTLAKQLSSTKKMSILKPVVYEKEDRSSNSHNLNVFHMYLHDILYMIVSLFLSHSL